MNAFKRQCIALRKQDRTLPEIVRMTGRPKTSVFFHIRDIALSARKQRRIREASRMRILKAAKTRKGKSGRTFKKFYTWDQNSVFLISHLLFDGEIRLNACIYNNRSRALIERVEKAMKKIYDFEPNRYQDKKTGVSRIGYYNVMLSPYLKRKSELLLEEITHLPKELRRVFLRSFFDDEGCIDFKPADGTRRVRGYQKNKKTLEIVEELLLCFDIRSRIQLPNEVVIVGKQNLLKFQKEINFSPGVRINGKRSNSVWKKHFEKRDLLKRAVDSYVL